MEYRKGQSLVCSYCSRYEFTHEQNYIYEKIYKIIRIDKKGSIWIEGESGHAGCFVNKNDINNIFTPLSKFRELKLKKLNDNNKT